MDPYEQQLLSVFNSYDLDNKGSLDRDSLAQLCQTLQLEEQGTDLIRCLLTEPKKVRATFGEFKEALLALLANVQNQNQDNGSPDREISPKFVYGSKKYGRRTRPKIDDQKSPDEKSIVKVQRSNSQSDANYAKKRKPNANGKLKRCTSFSGVVDCDKHVPSVVNESVLTSNDSLILSGMQFITLGPDGNGMVSSDVVLEMWENAGITAPKSLLNDLGFLGSQINIAELALVLEKELKLMQNPMENSYLNTSNPHIILLQASLALYQSEICCLKSIIEQMHQEREKLKCDVFDANNRATMLAQEVDDNHLKMEKSTENQVRLLEHKHSEALKELTEQFIGEKEQLTALNTKLEQKIHLLEAEEAKLRADLEYAQKLNSSLEKETQVASKQLLKVEDAKNYLEEKLQTLESERQEYESERIQIEPLLSKLSALQLENTDLRDKNDELSTEIESLTSELSLLKTKTSTHHHHHHQQQQQLTAGSQVHGHHHQHQNDMEALSIICEVGGTGGGAVKRRGNSPSKEFVASDGSPRLGKVRKCHGNVSSDLASLGMLPVPSTSSESGFDADLDSFPSMSGNELEEIARLQSRIAVLERELCNHGITVPCGLDNPACNKSDRSELLQVQQQCKTLQHLLQYTRSELAKILSENFKEDPHSVERIVSELKNKLEPCLFETITTTETTLDDRNTNEIGVNATAIAEATSMIEKHDKNDDDLKTKLDSYMKENEELTKKCADLETGIDLLRSEYEKCEDYWASKLDDERQMYEQEQSQSNEKLNELLLKMAEYEEQFANTNETDSRLPTIDEKDCLEKQFTDLEEEYEEYKQSSERLLEQKEEEICSLKEQLRTTSASSAKPKETADFGVQYSSRARQMMNLKNYVVEATNLFSVDTMPQFSPPPMINSNSSNNTNTNTSNSNSDEVDKPAGHRDYVNPNFLWNKHTTTMTTVTTEKLESNNVLQQQQQNHQQQQQQQQPYSLLSVSSTHSDQNNSINSTPCRPKRTRKYERNQLSSSQRLHKKENVDKEGSSEHESVYSSSRFAPSREGQHFPGQQTCVLPVSTIHNLNRRLHQLEQRCRQLQHVLKQQHIMSEQILQQTWQQHRGEKAELHYLLKTNQEKLDQQMRVCNEQLERLSRTDMLVKDLYVENAYLIANVQRLEQHCHLLTQCNASSSV